jgi:hypothetical protein
MSERTVIQRVPRYSRFTNHVSFDRLVFFCFPSEQLGFDLLCFQLRDDLRTSKLAPASKGKIRSLKRAAGQASEYKQTPYGQDPPR